MWCLCQVEELESNVRRLLQETEELRQAQQEQEEQASVTLHEETHKLRVQNQELQQQVTHRPGCGSQRVKLCLNLLTEA